MLCGFSLHAKGNAILRIQQLHRKAVRFASIRQYLNQNSTLKWKFRENNVECNSVSVDFTKFFRKIVRLNLHKLHTHGVEKPKIRFLT